jgi:Protein of unknown function (DUF1153)
MTNAAKSVIGPLGHRLTLDTLPPPQTKRWVRRRKAEVVIAVKCGLLTMQESSERYNLSDDEFLGWYEAYHLHGILGLEISQIAGRQNRGWQCGLRGPADQRL